MKEYYKTEMPDFFEVKSLILLYYIESYKHLKGEQHNFPELVYVNKGTHILEVNGISYELNEGQMFLIPSNEFHYAPIPGASLAIISFEADTEAFANIYHQIITLTPSQRYLLYDIFSQKHLFETIRNSDNYIGKKPTESTTRQELQVLKNLLENFLIDILYSRRENYSVSKKSNTDHYRLDQLNQLKDFMKSSIGKTLTLKELCNFSGFSMTKINLLFKDYEKMSPLTYFTTMKIEEAKKLIQKTNLNFSEIALQLGYESVHYFSKTFKKYTGLSPSDFSKKIIS